jgi:hypothetical protein
MKMMEFSKYLKLFSQIQYLLPLLTAPFTSCGTYGKQEMITGLTGKHGHQHRYYMQHRLICPLISLLSSRLHPKEIISN